MSTKEENFNSYRPYLLPIMEPPKYAISPPRYMLYNNVSPLLPSDYIPLDLKDLKGLKRLCHDAMIEQEMELLLGKNVLNNIEEQVHELIEHVPVSRQADFEKIYENVHRFITFTRFDDGPLQFDPKRILDKNEAGEVVIPDNIALLYGEICNYYKFSNLTEVPMSVIYYMDYCIHVREIYMVFKYLCMLLQLLYYRKLFYDQKPKNGEYFEDDIVHLWYDLTAPRHIDLSLTLWFYCTTWNRARICCFMSNPLQQRFKKEYNKAEDGTLTLKRRDNEMVVKTERERVEKKRKRDELNSAAIIVIDDDDDDTEEEKTVIYFSVLTELFDF